MNDVIVLSSLEHGRSFLTLSINVDTFTLSQSEVFVKLLNCNLVTILHPVREPTLPTFCFDSIVPRAINNIGIISILKKREVSHSFMLHYWCFIMPLPIEWSPRTIRYSNHVSCVFISLNYFTIGSFSWKSIRPENEFALRIL
jgi:hypothetical protein